MSGSGMAMLGTGDGDGRTLVVVFLRGGADGLALMPPVHDDAYGRARPGEAAAPPGALPLSPPFALHPTLAPLSRFLREGKLALVPACGSDDQTRSHFEAQDLMELGGSGGGGWLGRLLASRHRASGMPPASLGAVALGTTLPESLRGAPGATALRSLGDLAMDRHEATLVRLLPALYDGDAELAAPARDSIAALHRLADLGGRDRAPSNGAVYGADAFGRALARVAQLVDAAWAWRWRAWTWTGGTHTSPRPRSWRAPPRGWRRAWRRWQRISDRASTGRRSSS